VVPHITRAFHLGGGSVCRSPIIRTATGPHDNATKIRFGSTGWSRAANQRTAGSDSFIRTAEDLVQVLPAVMRAVARGQITAQEGEAFGRMLESQQRVVEASEYEARIRALSRTLPRTQAKLLALETRTGAGRCHAALVQSIATGHGRIAQLSRFRHSNGKR